MSFARPWWLAALALLLPLILLHLRRPSPTLLRVPTLRLWERFAGAPDARQSRFRRPRSILLLVLQALALAGLAVALAGPSVGGGSLSPRTVYVVDDSLWMHVGTRIAGARTEILRRAHADPAREVAVVMARAQPSIAYRGKVSGLSRALDGVRASAGPADLAGALAVAGGLTRGSGGSIVVLRAPEDAMPAVHAARGQLTQLVAGTAADDVGIFDPSARCGIGPDDACVVLASIRNGSGRARVVRYTARSGGGSPLSLSVSVPAGATRRVALTAQPATAVTLRLRGADALALDDSARVAVPGEANVAKATTVTLVGSPSADLPVAQALASVPGVTLRLRTSKDYRDADARASALVIVDGTLPGGRLPSAPATLLVEPANLPGGRIGATIAAPLVTGTDPSSPLLDGVDVTSLSVDRGAARRLTLPAWMAPLIWTRDGALLAAGDNGSHQVAVLAFDPNKSNLPQLPALPVLMRNVVRWATGSVPAPVTRPTAGGTEIDLAPWDTVSVAGRPSSLTPWLIVLALLAATGEWLVWWRVRR